MKKAGKYAFKPGYISTLFGYNYFYTHTISVYTRLYEPLGEMLCDGRSDVICDHNRPYGNQPGGPAGGTRR